MSNADGLILNKVLKDQDVTFIMGVKLTQDPMTNLGCKIVKNIQITPSSPDKNAISNLVKHVKSGNNILIFPVWQMEDPHYITKNSSRSFQPQVPLAYS